MNMIRPKADCALCPLCRERTNIVLPSGNLESRVVFVGEAPGENEDLMGKPFVGRAGKILDDAFAKAGIDRESVMITNTVKCRPPNNRDPTQEEMSACRPFLDSELESRSLIVGLGKSAIRDIIGYEGPMADIVNKIQTVTIGGNVVNFLPTYHPMACIYRKFAREELMRTISIVKEAML